MSAPQSVARDERTVAVENASYVWGYILLAFGLLIDVAYRGMFRHEAAWDLLALVIASSGVCTIYQVRQKTLPHGWAKRAVLIACVAAVTAAAVAVVLAVARGM